VIDTECAAILFLLDLRGRRRLGRFIGLPSALAAGREESREADARRETC
jgi:hypothetical protein